MTDASYETNTVGVNPGDQQNLFFQAPADLVLKDVAVDKGLELLWFVAGAMRVHPQDGRFQFGQKVKAKTFVTAIVKNTTDKLVFGKATWFAEGSNLPKQAASPVAGIVPPAKAPALATKPVRQSSQGSGKTRITDYPVGKNELAVAMTYGEAKRLLDVISGGPPVMGTERPAFLRRFNHALAIFQNQEVPETEEEDSEELKAARAYADMMREENEKLMALVAEKEEQIRLRDEELKAEKARQPDRDFQATNEDAFGAGYEKAMVDMSSFAQAKLKTALVELQMEAAREDEATKVVHSRVNPSHPPTTEQTLQMLKTLETAKIAEQAEEKKVES